MLNIPRVGWDVIQKEENPRCTSLLRSTPSSYFFIRLDSDLPRAHIAVRKIFFLNIFYALFVDEDFFFVYYLLRTRLRVLVGDGIGEDGRREEKNCVQRKDISVCGTHSKDFFSSFFFKN